MTRPAAERLADRLHDELLPLLAVMRQDLLEDAPRAELLTLVDDAIGVTRAMVTDAHPGASYQALEDALDAVTRPAAALAGMRLSIDVDFDCRKLSAEQYALVIGAVAELVRNATEHSEAASIAVHGVTQPGGWRLSVTDDGHGIDAQAAQTRRDRGHLGLRRMRRELRSLGGRLVLASGPDGTAATIHLTAPDGVEP